MEKLRSHLLKRIQVIERLGKSEEIMAQIQEAAQLLKAAVDDGYMILVCGNGGSAAEAQHMTAEFVGRYLVEREGWPAIALVSDVAALTAISNDYGFDEVFARQVTAYKQCAKILLLLSTSGTSKNLEKAVYKAKSYGIKTIALLGRDGGTLAPLCDISIVVPSTSTAEIQEVHLIIIHIICELLESEYNEQASCFSGQGRDACL